MSDLENKDQNPENQSEDAVNDAKSQSTTQTDPPQVDNPSSNEELNDKAQAEVADSDDFVENDELSELEEAQHEIAKLKDAFLRAKAEEDNVRRRAEKEVANSRKFAVEGFAKEMLNVYDSLKLATNNEPADDADETVKSIYEGSKITLNQLNSAFAKFSLKEIAPQVGDKLDPNLHQAMSMVESDEVASGHILTVIQSGFELHDRLLRPAMVVVVK